MESTQPEIHTARERNSNCCAWLLGVANIDYKVINVGKYGTPNTFCTMPKFTHSGLWRNILNSRIWEAFIGFVTSINHNLDGFKAPNPWICCSNPHKEQRSTTIVLRQEVHLRSMIKHTLNDTIFCGFWGRFKAQGWRNYHLKKQWFQWGKWGFWWAGLINCEIFLMD